ncbi:MAG: hypothetical protein L0H55_13140 [Candidatus Nitrosocosmicus sp.]|nr:hypothetical protein [Candidatus Nitrosocosmicus sp.]
MIGIVHAHPFPFSNPYETINYIIPIITMPIPSVVGNMPRAAMSTVSVKLPSDDTADKMPAKVIKPMPPTKSAMQPMIV